MLMCLQPPPQKAKSEPGLVLCICPELFPGCQALAMLAASGLFCCSHMSWCRWALTRAHAALAAADLHVAPLFTTFCRWAHDSASTPSTSLHTFFPLNKKIPLGRVCSFFNIHTMPHVVHQMHSPPDQDLVSAA